MAEAFPSEELSKSNACDLCDTEFLVNWSCHECSQTLCDNCQTLHARSNASREHAIRFLRDVNDDDVESGSDVIEIDEIEVCRVHDGQVCERFCKLCDMLVCQICIKDIHKTHCLADITDSAEEKFNQLNKKFGHLEKYELEKARKLIEKYEENKIDYVTQGCNKKDAIKERNEKLKFELDSITDGLLREIETKEEVDLQFITRKQHHLHLLTKKLKETIGFCRNNIANKSGVTLLDACAEAEHKVDKLKLSSSDDSVGKLNPPTFIPGKLEKEDVQRLFGSLEYEDRPILIRRRTTVAFPQSIKAQITASFNQKVRNGIYSICTTGNGNAMIGTEERAVQVVTTTGKVLASIKVDITPYNIACSSLGKDLYMSTWNMEIKRLQNGAFIRFVDTSPFHAQGLFVNEDGDVLACLFHKEEKMGKVVRYDSSGKVLHELCFDSSGTLLFQNPSKIASNSSRDIFVVDMASKSVVAVAADGQQKFNYTGVHGSKFEPKCIDCSIIGSILVGDHNEDRIHLLDKTGKFLQYIMTKEHGLTDIIGIASDVEEKRIWVCCYDKMIIAKLV